MIVKYKEEPKWLIMNQHGLRDIKTMTIACELHYHTEIHV